MQEADGPIQTGTSSGYPALGSLLWPRVLGLDKRRSHGLTGRNFLLSLTQIGSECGY